MFEAICIGNTQQTLKKNGRSFLRYTTSSQKRIKSDSFDAHFKQHFNSTTSGTYLTKCMAFTSLNQINYIGALKTSTKPNYKLCMDECLTILKKLRYKFVTVDFFLITDYPV